MLRRGYSLVEMLVVLTVGAVIVGICVGLLHTLLRTEQNGRERVPQTRILVRLAEQFRTDVSAAVRQVASARQGEWQFALPGDRVVTYQASPGEVRWEERTQGKPAIRETYVLPRGCSAAITVHSQAAPPVASLVVADKNATQQAAHEIRVVAVLGKDHRFTRSPGGGR